MILRTRRTIYLDSSILVGATLAGSSHHQATSDFCNRLTQESYQVVISSLVRFEFLNVAFKLASGRRSLSLPVDAQHVRDPLEWSSDYRTRRSWILTVVDAFDRNLDSFADLIEISVNPSIWQETADTVARYQLGSYDALHVATALDAGIYSFATCDRHFLSVGEINTVLVRDDTELLFPAP